MPNLTLIDLPGIIRSTEKEEEKLHVNLVRNLVIDYIKKPNAIIVATVSLKQEMENTVVRALARQADPTGVRTVGVLTKPDRIEAGAHQQKIDVLTGKMYRLEHGYWVVKSRTPAQLESGISFEEARMDERNFFRNTAPWNTLPTYVKQRLGSDFLEAKLGKILSSTISTALPLMKKRAEELLRQTRAELKAMAPGLTKSPRMYLLNIIRSFMEKVVQHVSAKHGSKQLWQLVHARFQIFWNTLQRTRPVFALKRTTQRQRMQDRIRHKVAGKPSRHEKDVTATVTNSGEQEVVERTWWGGTKVVKVNDAASAVGSLAAIATSAASAGAAGVGSFAKSVSGSSSDSSSVSSNHPLAGSSNIKVKTKRREAPEASVRKRAPKEEGKKLKSGAGRLSGITPTYSFGDVTKIIEGERGRQLRGHAPYQAKAKLIKDFLIEWRKPAQQCVSNVSEALQSLTRSLIMEEFGRFDDLASKVGLIVGNLLLQLETEARSKVDMLADMEQYQPFTLNNEYFDSSKTKILYQLREKAFGAGKREAMSVKEAIEHEQDMENAVSALAKLGYIHDKETLTKMASQPISAEDRELDEVLEVVGEVLAYFKVAYKRFGDLVPMVIDNQFMLRFTELLDDKMISELKILESDDDTISMLLSEDPMVVRRRAELEAREKRLAEVCKELINFGVGLGM